MHLSSWIGGFLLGLVFSTVCAWIDGFFYRRSHRLQHDKAVEQLASTGRELVEVLKQIQTAAGGAPR